MLEKSERKNEMLEKLNVTEKETRNHWTLIDNARNPCTNGSSFGCKNGQRWTNYARISAVDNTRNMEHSVASRNIRYPIR